jgi:hypothetical protein
MGRSFEIGTTVSVIYIKFAVAEAVIVSVLLKYDFLILD